MRQGILVATAVAATLVGASGALAQPLPPMAGPPPGYYESRAYYPPPPPVTRYVHAPQDAAMPSYEVARILRETGFMPLGGARRRGDFYTVSAIHPNGDDGRVVIDAYTGRVVRFVPASNFIRGSERGGGDEMVMVYRGATFPPPDAGPARRVAPPPASAYSLVSVAPPVNAPPPRQPQVASRTPSAAPLATPKPRPQAAPKGPSTAQAPPVASPPVKPAEAKPVAAPPAETKPAEAKPETPAGPLPTQALPPVQTME